MPAIAFREFRERYPQGANYAQTVGFFERSSASTNNDYIVAFADSANLVTVRDGRRTSGISKTHWIGDKDAYYRFREYEHYRGRQRQQGRAVNAAVFADEMAGSPASDLYSIMRNVVLDRQVPSVGGFVTVLSSRDIGFRFSVYSGVLLDWPTKLNENEILQLTDKIDLRASGENDRYSVSQISPGYYNMNAVAFYVLKGQLLVAFYEVESGATTCATFRSVEPDQIAAATSFGRCQSARTFHSRGLPREWTGYGLPLLGINGGETIESRFLPVNRLHQHAREGAFA
jgi:hypothetical protein